MDAIAPRRLRVQRKHWEADGVTSVMLVDPSDAELPTWTPGSHVALHLPGDLVREYSLCSDPADTSGWTVAVLRTPDSKGGSRYIHERLMVGELVDVDGPRDNFALDETAERHVLVAGGIGITPILAMVRALEARRADWRLLYAGRTRSTMAFLPELTSYGDRVTVHADDEAGGLPDLGTVLADSVGATVYCCGPEPLLQGVENVLPTGVPLRKERFKAPAVVRAEAADAGFDVILNSTGQRIAVAPDTTVLHALLAVGVDVPSSCTEGICGTCEVGVVKGDVDHRDFLLSPEERASGSTMFICVSRCRSAELVLDI